MSAYREVRIGVEKIDLLLQFVRRRPIVVTFEYGKILAGEGAEPTVEVLLRDLEADIFLVEVRLDDMRILSDISHDNFLRSIGGAILNHVDFEVEIGLLHQNAFQRLCDIFCMIVGDHHDADLRPMRSTLLREKP